MFCIALTAAHSAPSNGIESDRLDQAAGDDVRRCRSSAGRSPRRCPACRIAGPQVPEHPRLDDAVAERARRARAGWSVGRGGAGGREHPQVAGHREHEERRRAPEQRRRRAGRAGRPRRLEHRQPASPCGRSCAAGRACGRVIERSAPASRGRGPAAARRPRATRARPSGLPGTLTTRLPPRTPTTPRDRAANGVERAAVGAHRLGDARDLVVEDGGRRLRRHVARRQARAAGRDDERGEPAAPSTSAASIAARSSGTTRRSTVKPSASSRACERLARRVRRACRRRSGR